MKTPVIWLSLLLLTGCAHSPRLAASAPSSDSGASTPASTVNQAELRGDFQKLVEDFQNSKLGVLYLRPLATMDPATHAEFETYLLPASCDPVIQAGEPAVPMLKSFATSEGEIEAGLAKVCIRLIRGWHVVRQDPVRSGSVRLVPYTMDKHRKV